jgi:hypothetical protein
MELNICELDINSDNFNNFDDYDNIPLQTNKSYEEIPENMFPTKVIKNVRFDDNNLYSQKPIHQSIPKVNAKMVRPKMSPQNPKISYEDILSKMGMFVSNGKLHLLDRNTLTPEQHRELLDKNKKKEDQSPRYTTDDTQNIPQNSYIYNKLFKDQIQPQNIVRKPRTLEEYKRMLVEDYLKRERIKQIKSTRLIMPTSNINISVGNSTQLQNKLFSLSKR